MSSYPEHDKLAKVKDQTQAIGEFLEWMGIEYHAHLLCRHVIQGCYVEPSGSVQDWLAEWAGIDRDELEREKRAMLDALRAGDKGE